LYLPLVTAFSFRESSYAKAQWFVGLFPELNPFLLCT
jgi:hypothetical protein